MENCNDLKYLDTLFNVTFIMKMIWASLRNSLEQF